MIRTISRFDYDRIYELLRAYRDQSGIEQVSKLDNSAHIELVLNHIRAGAGVGLVACRDQEGVGILLGIISPMVWDPHHLTLNELVFYVDVKSRFGRLGYLLLKEYVRIGQGMKRTGQIQAFTMTRRAGTTLNYSRFGFRPVDENWAQ